VSCVTPNEHRSCSGCIGNSASVQSIHYYTMEEADALVGMALINPEYPDDLPEVGGSDD
jgi:hypothetical protein